MAQMISPTLNPTNKRYGDPFLLPSAEEFPKDIKSTLDLCLYLYGLNSIYGAVIDRLVAYFITELEFLSAEDGKLQAVPSNEQRALRAALVDTMQIFTVCQQAGVEWGIYGNAFVRCVEPFDRWLVYDKNDRNLGVALDVFPQHLITYNWESLTYTVPDIFTLGRIPPPEQMEKLPTVELKFRDKASAAVDRFALVFLDPRCVELSKAHHSNVIEYIYRIPPDMESRIKAGTLHEVNNTPFALLDAVAKNKDFRFRKGEIYHFKKPSPSGVSNSGWAVPPIILHYHSLYQLQIYRKADYAVAQEYLHPMRVFTPSFGDKIGDALLGSMMMQWRSEMKKMIAQHRLDPTTIHAAPFPLSLNTYGGEGRQMVLHEVVEAYTDALFDGLGMPRELFRGTMQLDQSPTAFRLFERHYEWLFQQLTGLVGFVARTLQRATDADEIVVRLKRPAMAYNAEWLHIRMQMAANREIPRAAVYPDVGVSDPEAAAAQAIAEDQNIQRISQEMSAAFEKEVTQGSMADLAIAQAEQSMQGAPPPGGSAGGGLDYSVDVGADPTMVQQRAQEIAAQWIQMHAEMPHSHRKEMQNCESINPTLYAAAKDAMEKMRSGAASQGRAQTAQLLAER
jgi:hypothetical protein